MGRDRDQYDSYDINQDKEQRRRSKAGKKKDSARYNSNSDKIRPNRADGKRRRRRDWVDFQDDSLEDDFDDDEELEELEYDLHRSGGRAFDDE